MLSIQTNVDSLIAQQNLNINNNFQANTIQQLTSGYRINSAGDDAAGLAVANQYRDQIAELNQGVLNANDGSSQLQIMDGGLDNISTMLDRLQTLATESASTTFTGNRSTLNNEYQSLLGEIDRQADNIGLGATNSSNIRNIGVYIGGGQDANTNSTVSVNLANSGVGTAALGLSSTSVLTTGSVQLSTALAKAIQAGDSATFQIYNTSGQHTITLNGQPNDTLTSQMGELNTQLSNLGISASLNSTGNLQFTSANAFSVSAQANTATSGIADNLVHTASGDAADNTGLNYKNYQPVASTAYNLQITVGGTTATASIASSATPANAANVQAINSALSAAGITSVSAVLDQTATGGIELEGSTTFSYQDNSGGSYGAVSNSTAPLTANGANPQTAIDAITAAIQNLGSTQGKIGAGENTLNYAINLAQSQITNFSSAQSQISDANVAQEAANLTKAQVLQQTSIAAMAQANSAPQALLKLFQ